jgi:hypothetical protein
VSLTVQAWVDRIEIGMTEPRAVEDALERAATLVGKGRTVDSVLADLRADGFSMIDCIRVVMKLQSCALPDAKRIVHESAAWADLRDAHEAAHAELARKLSE